MKITHFLIFVLLLISCRKEKPRGDDAEIIGKYEWSYSHKTVPTSNGNTIESYIYSNDEEDKYGIEVTKNGYIYLYKNSKKIDRARIKEITRSPHYSGANLSFSKPVFSGSYDNNTIVLHYFPFGIPWDDDELFGNIFIKK